jgi:hypothetical protein
MGGGGGMGARERQLDKSQGRREKGTTMKFIGKVTRKWDLKGKFIFKWRKIRYLRYIY